MSILAKLKSLLPSRRRALEQDMREELEALASIAESDGARKDLGSLTQAAEDGRSAWTWVWLDQLAADLRYSMRTMRRSPIFTLTAVLSLGLGIGANTAIFSLMSSILLKPLPVNDPDTLVVLTSYSRNDRIGDFGYPDYLALREENTAFADILAASRLVPIDAGLRAEGVTIQRKVVSSNYFSALGVRLIAGRTFADGEDDVPLAVVSDRWCRSAFGSAANALGQKIDLDGKPFEIVGIAPADFLSETVGESVDVWTTIALMPPERRTAPGFTWLNLLGRLKPGVTTAQAHASLRPRIPQMLNRFIERVEVEPGRLGGSGLRNSFVAPLKVLMAIVAVTLLMACTNLAGLLLARSTSRQREIATRLAIGASRNRLFRQFLTESLSMAMLGGLVGLALSFWGQKALLSLVSGAGRTISLDLRPDLTVLAFTALLSLFAGVLFGLAPALQAIRENHGKAITMSAHEPHRRGGFLGIRGWLVAFQVALSMLLLVVGGLFIRTLQNLKNQDLGFSATNVLSVQIDAKRGDVLDWPAVLTELTRRVESVPGVQSATGSHFGTLSNAGGIMGFRVEGHVSPEGLEQRAGANWVGPRYLATLGIPLLKGREFSPGDNANTQRVAIVNQAMAHYYSGNESIIGRNLILNGTAYQIVGVTQNAKYSDLREAPRRFVYFAALQSKSEIHSLDIRTSGLPHAIARDIRHLVKTVDPRLRVFHVATLEQRIDQKLARETLVADLAGFFAGLTLVLVVIGVYGTLAYSVARRTKEIGIRIALGARLASIAAAVLHDLWIIVFIGLALGLGLALLGGQLLSRMLFGLRPSDPWTIITGVLILALAMLIAGSIPVLRAWRVDPTTALRLD